MTNSEKYKFDDFTLVNYKRLVALALKRGFVFLSYADEYEKDRKDILWRHDVEFEPDIALKFAEIERALGVKSTYFFQLHSPYYNIFDKHYSDVLLKIQALGHHIGLHFAAHYYNIQNEADLEKYLVLDKNYFEAVFGITINSFSFHVTSSFTNKCERDFYAGLINVYSSHFKKNFNYCGDSLGYWRFDRLEDVLNDESVQHLQVLTHDANWSEEVLSPRKRMHKFVYDRAKRLYNGQVYGLIEKGMLCPDDEE